VIPKEKKKAKLNPPLLITSKPKEKNYSFTDKSKVYHNQLIPKSVFF
jgi:hypothetical protein